MTARILIVIPVLNEERDLPRCVDKLSSYCESQMNDYDWAVCIADNGSTDTTQKISMELAETSDRVTYMREDKKGRGRAIKRAWSEFEADVFAYMDVDLSTGLEALPKAISMVQSGLCDIAIGSRLVNGSQVVGRSLRRGFISRCYSMLFRSLFLVSFRDAQCGFKVISSYSAQRLLPTIVDNGWFFDTELLIIAEKSGYQVREIPVVWTDDPNSKVNILSTAWRDIKGLLRLRFYGLKKAQRRLF